MITDFSFCYSKFLPYLMHFFNSIGSLFYIPIMSGCRVLEDVQDKAERSFPCNVETDLRIFPGGAECVYLRVCVLGDCIWHATWIWSIPLKALSCFCWAYCRVYFLCCLPFSFFEKIPFGNWIKRWKKVLLV